MIDKFYDNHVREVSKLIELLETYNDLIKSANNLVTKKFYSYSLKLAINRINELIGGDEKLRNRFQERFEKDILNIFEDNSDDPFRGVE